MISGGSLENIGAHEICIIATDPNTGVLNSEVVFTLIIMAKLQVEQAPSIIDKVLNIQVGDEPIEIDLPTFKNSKNIDYKLS